MSIKKTGLTFVLVFSLIATSALAYSFDDFISSFDFMGFYSYFSGSLNRVTGYAVATASSCPVGKNNFVLNGDFSNAGDNWTYEGCSGYAADYSNSTAYIRGDGFNCGAYIYQVLDISDWDGANLTLSMDWRAASGYASSSVTNANIKIVPTSDACNSSSPYYTYALVAGGTTDTGWKSYSGNVADNLSGKIQAKLCLGLWDAWISTWNQKNWYDNIMLCGATATTTSSTRPTTIAPTTTSLPTTTPTTKPTTTITTTTSPNTTTTTVPNITTTTITNITTTTIITTDKTPPTISNVQNTPTNPTTADKITIKATATDNQSSIQLCQIVVPVVVKVNGTVGFTYANSYKIYSDIGSNDSWARVLVKSLSGNNLDTVVINQGDSKTTDSTSLIIGVISVSAYENGEIKEVILSVIKWGGFSFLYQNMTASDGAYDEKTEDVEKNIGKFGYESYYTVFLKCKDTVGNWNTPVSYTVHVTTPIIKPKITSFSCSSIGSLKAQCTVGTSNLNSSKKYYAYVAGSGKGNSNPAVGATVFPGTSKSVTIVVLTLKADTYQLGAWLFEGTNPDVIKPALAFWAGTPVEVTTSLL